MSSTLIFLCAVIGSTSGSGLLPQDSVNVSVGDSVIFNTSLAQNSTEFNFISWSFGPKMFFSMNAGVTFLDADYEDRVVLFNRSGSLQLNNVTLNDTGEYRVNISVAEGETAMSGLSTLNVYEKITKISIDSSPFYPVEGLSLNLTCDASGSILTREWMINDTEIIPTDNIQFHDQRRVLSFDVLGRYDLGKITCRLSNPLQHVNISNYGMIVHYGPENVRISGRAAHGNVLKLSCSAESVPPAKYTWTRNGYSVGYESPQYNRYDLEPSDSGEYACHARNDVTMKSSEASLSVIIIETPNEDLSAGAIVGITLTPVVIIAIAAVAGFCIWKRKKDRRPQSKTLFTDDKNTSTIHNIYTEKEDNKHIYEDIPNTHGQKK